MGKVIQQKIKGMNIWAKVGLVTTITLLLCTFMYQGWYKPKGAEAALSPLNAWTTAATQTATTGNPTAANFIVNSGNDRILVVVVDCFDNGGSAGQTFSATYGGTALNEAVIENSDRRQTWIGYLALGNSATNTTQSLSVTITGTHTNAIVYAASYQGVDQSAPITATSSAYSTLTTIQPAPTATVNAGGYAFYTWAYAGTRTSDTETYTEHSDTTNGTLRAGVASKQFATAGTTQPTITFGTARGSVSLVTVNPAPSIINPTVTSTSPNALQIGDTADVTITGTGFQSGATASFGAGITVNSTTYNSATSLTANITVTATTGARNVTVTNLDTGSGTGTGVFTVNAAPTVTSTTPNSRTQGQTNQNITITGTGFSNTPTAPTVVFSGTGITVTSVTYTSATSLTANIDVAPTATTGARNVTVTNARGSAGTGSGVFTVNAAPAPTVTSTSPNSAGQGANNIDIIINGTNFVSGATAAFSGTGITVNSTTFNSALSLTANISITTGAATGARDVTVTNPNTLSGSLAGGFSVTAGVCVRSAPTVSLGSAGSVIPGSSLAYVVSITNNDTVFADCLPTSTFALTLSDTNGTDFTIPSTLSPASIAVAPGATGTVTLTVTAKATATVGNTNTTTVTATDSANHAGQPGSGNVITTAVSSWINNNLLHNSDNLQSLKHGGAWGKPGTFLGAITCSTCHSPAKSGNIGRIRTSISAPDGSFTNRTVTFTTHSGASTSFGDDSGGARTSSFRICEVCHTSDGNSSYNQSSNGTYVHAYNQGAARQHYNNNDCTRCHGHEWAFEGESRGGRSCGPCHRTTYLSMQSKSGYHHYIYNSYTGYPHAAPTNDTQKVCLQCHVDHNIFRPEVNPANTGALGGRAANLRVDIVGADPVKGTTTPGTGTNQYVRTDFVGNSTNGGLCTSCHKAVITKSTNQQSSSTTTTPIIDVAAYYASMHNYSAPSKKFKDGSQFKANCSKCHNAQNNEPSPNFTDVATHDSSNRSLLGALGGTPYSTYAGNFCYRCHSQIDDAIGGTKKSANRNDWYGAFTNMSARSTVIYKTVNKTYNHPVSNYTTSRHKPVETAAADFSGTNRHVTCNDCHNPHAATRANAISGTSGIDPTNSTAGAAPASYSMITVTDPDHQYKVCFKCHTNWAGYGTGTTNLAVDFNTANDSFHWVEKDKYTYTVNSGTGKGIWKNAQFNLSAVPTQGTKTYVQVMMPRTGITYDNATLRTLALRCSDCHGSNGADGGVTVPEGPHGSTIANILKVPAGSPYTTWNASTSSLTGDTWCLNCHDPTFANSGFRPSEGHLYGGSGKHQRACQYCHLAIPHGSGSEGAGVTNQRKHLLKPATFTEGIDSETSGSQSQHGNWVIPGCT